jgi:adenylate kinase
MATRFDTVLLFGAPGVGKGTQGKILGRIPGFFHQSSGDVFRTIDVHSEAGKKFMEHSSRGELVPDELTIEVWRRNLEALRVLSLFKPRGDLLILDGIPRTVNQAKIMDQYIDVLKIIHLVCEDREAMITRLRRRALKENRADDAREEVIRRRFEVYEAESV